MNLYGSITALQTKEVDLYLKLEHRFKENQLIRDLWSAMAHDVAQQISSLRVLPSSFWSQLTKDPDGQFEAALETAHQQLAEKTEDLSLKSCFELTLCLEERTILKIYVPIIRSLRQNWINPALDFYIVVKGHLARIVRVTESFSGDPIAIQRSNLLLQSFEKEVQAPRAGIYRTAKATKEKKPREKPQKALKHARPLAKRATIHRNRAKPLVKKVDLQRRRAHR
jgi:hypothetical protein